MKIWILLILAIVLLLWGMRRETFDPAKQRPEKTDESLRRTVESVSGTTSTDIVDGYIEALQNFYDTKYLPEKKTPTPSAVDDFVGAQEVKPGMKKSILTGMVNDLFKSADSPPAEESATQANMRGTSERSEKRREARTAGGMPEPICPTGFTFDDLTCKSIAETEPNTDDACPDGNGMFARPNSNGKCTTSAKPSCPPGYSYTTVYGDMLTLGMYGKCEPGGAAGGVPGQGPSGGTTGGSSSSFFGDNSGGGGSRQKQVFGPIANGRGEGGVRPMDSSKTNQYPELLGGDGGRASTRIQGGGIVNPSGMGITLPSSKSLGSDENSKFFPFSRQPGDMELIPDPYRVSQQFSAASYSFKTEPVPFLTDFSAFQR